MILPRFSPFFQKRTVILQIFNRDFLTVLHIVGKLSKLWSWHPATAGVVRWPSAGDTVVSRVFSDARPRRTARRRVTRNDAPLTPAVDVIVDPGLSDIIDCFAGHVVYSYRRPSTCRPRTVRGVGWMSRRSDKSCGGRRCAAARSFRRTSTRWLICRPTTASSTPSSTDFCRCEHPHVEVVRQILGSMTTVFLAHFLLRCPPRLCPWSTTLRHVHHSSQYPHFLLFSKPSPLRR